MFSLAHQNGDAVMAVDGLDRLVIAYLTIPLIIFLIGWFEWWMAAPLLACLAYAFKPLRAKTSFIVQRFPVTRPYLIVAIGAGCLWTLLGGTDHLFFANADWHTRDAVLHDLVASQWPVGYGPLNGTETLLRAPLAYYLPAALLGKIAGLGAGHLALAVWTAMGATLFLLQILTVVRSSAALAPLIVSVIVLFSGLDIIGNLINDGPRFRSDWNITMHLEWWAGSYQYSSMTTQLFWVPNHALCGWLIVGLLYRNIQGGSLDVLLPMLVVVAALWSPLSAIGLVPFVGWRLIATMIRRRSTVYLSPRIVVPVLAVGIVVAAYLSLDLNRIPRNLSPVNAGNEGVMVGLRQLQFFLLEAGCIGFLILALRRSGEVVLALVILALLPLISFGAANEFVMRASIPSLAILAIGASVALTSKDSSIAALKKKATLGCLLVIGAVTPVEEVARAAILPAWPVNLQATVVGSDCGHFSPNYVARLTGGITDRLLRKPVQIPLGPQGPQACNNPALELMWRPSEEEKRTAEQIRNRMGPHNTSKSSPMCCHQ